MNIQHRQQDTNIISTRMKALVVAGFIAAAVVSLRTGHAGAAPQTPPAQARERFDFLVRADFFAGYAGDQAALDRGMKVCEDTLRKNANHAEALVWHGGGLVFIAGQAFREADLRKGSELWDQGLKEMDRAVDLEPSNVGVLIPRGATLLTASRFVQDKNAQGAMLEKGVRDYERVLEIQKPYFATLSSHARSELLFGLAEGSMRLGDSGKARGYFQRIATECKDSMREKQATAWLQRGVLPPTDPMSCSGCHTK